MTVEAYLIYLAALAAFFVTPPDTSQLLIMSNSLRHGLRRSLWTVAGDLGANVVQMTAAGFGLVAVIATSASVLVWVKWAGVAYLIWIGLSLFLRTPATDRPGAAPLARRRVLFRQGASPPPPTPTRWCFSARFSRNSLIQRRPSSCNLFCWGAPIYWSMA